MNMKLKGIDLEKMRFWVKRAKDNKSNDPIYSFISAWIAFNYYYSTFATEQQKEFETFAKKIFKGNLGDKAQWSFLIGHDKFDAYFNGFKERNSEIFENYVLLPVKSVISKNEVPYGISGKYKLKVNILIPLILNSMKIKNY